MMSRPGHRGRTVTTGVVAFAAGVASWMLGITVLNSLLVAAAAATMMVVLPVSPLEVDQRPAVPRIPERPGTRRELMRLSWSYGRGTSGAGTAAIERLIGLARQRLRDHGIDADNPADAPAAQRLLGSTAYRVMVTREIAPPVAHRTVAACLDALERLDDTPSDRPT